MKIILAQGNPEPEYTGSRHNVGFLALNSLAKKFDGQWLDKPKFYAFLSEITIENEKVLLVKPKTFYNETGKAARKFIDFYKIDQSADLLVIHDDLALPIGALRIRQQGGDGGNNGIKSLNFTINPNYTRIRIGISNEQYKIIDDTNFVLGKFNTEESEKLKNIIIPQVIEIVEQFCKNNLKPTSLKISE